jgi:hypothetical protein
MRFRSLAPALLPAALTASTVLLAAALPARGQDSVWHSVPAGCCSPPPAAVYPLPAWRPVGPGSAVPGGYCPQPAPPVPITPVPGQPLPPTAPAKPGPATPPTTPTTPTRPGTTPTQPGERTPEEQQRQQQDQQQQDQQQQQNTQGEQGQAGAGEASLASNVLGDQLGVPGLTFIPVPGVRHARAVSVAVPSVRSFKIAEDESPRPQDRVYVDFNYFNNVNRSVNETLGSPFHNINVYRETFGVEKMFLGDLGAVELRLPLNTLSADSTTPGLGGVNNTDIGDLSIIGKVVLWRDCNANNLVSGGLAVTAPTGPDSFANSPVFVPVHSTLVTPFAGWIFRQDKWYVQGFTSLDVPVDSKDVTLLHNDFHVGYVLHRCQDANAWLTAVLPNLEVHINDPLNHRGATNLADPLGTPDWIDLTTGVTFEFQRRATLAVGVVTPVTGPKPYDFELLAQLNVRFGATLQQAQGSQLGD